MRRMCTGQIGYVLKRLMDRQSLCPAKHFVLIRRSRTERSTPCSSKQRYDVMPSCVRMNQSAQPCLAALGRRDSSQAAALGVLAYSRMNGLRASATAATMGTTTLFPNWRYA